MNKILVTGAAGFIGMHVAKYLLHSGEFVVGLDNLNDYYDVELKKNRLGLLGGYKNFKFLKMCITDLELSDLMAQEGITQVIHLAAQAGVRYSVTNPRVYGESNLMGFLNVLEACRDNKIKHLIFASSSSVYGGNTKVPFAEIDTVDHPVSLYAATKRSNELMAHAYSHLFELPVTGLRFFTVYGPWGRPDQSLFLFMDAIYSGKPIQIFNNGEMFRDFTYIDDVVYAIVRALQKPPDSNPCFNSMAPLPDKSWAAFRIFNVGSNHPIQLMEFISALEEVMGFEANKQFLPIQDGDVLGTFSSVDSAKDWLDYSPRTSIKDGISRFVEWYKDYYQKNKL